MNSPLKIISLFGKFWQEKTNILFIRWNLLVIVIGFVLVFIKLNNLPPQLPMFYTLPWGESQLVTTTTILLLPILSLSILLVNHLLAVLLFSFHRLLSEILIIVSFITSLLSFTALVNIIILVT